MSTELTVRTAIEGQIVESATGGGLEGAERTQRETLRWTPHMGSPDQIINRGKPLADARSRDMSNNDGYIHGAIGISKDSIVGSHYRLNCNPVLAVLSQIHPGFNEAWLGEFRKVTEARFDLIGESENCYLDAAGVNTLTELTRLAVGSDFVNGEIISTAEWIDNDRSRPVSTAVQMVAPSRLCNPNGMADTRFLKRGVEKDQRGRPVAYHFRMAHPGEYLDAASFGWRRVPVAKRWGRRQVLHLFEQNEPDQSRGIGDIVSVLKNTRMTKQYDELTIQKAVVDASYASAIESEMPPDAIYGAMGGNNGSENFMQAIGAYMTMIAQYYGGAENVNVDGVTVPILPPGTKMTTRSIGTPTGVSGDFGKSLLRHTAAGLGLSAEEFMNNFSDANYSGLKGSFAFTEKRMKSRKKRTADRFASFVYTLYLEEDFTRGDLPLPKGVSPEIFYMPLVKQALSRSSWIGAGSGQIDELKETQAAILRIKSGLSTYEIEISKLGGDYRERFQQRAREEGIITGLKLGFSLETSKSTGAAKEPVAPDQTTKKEPA